MRMMCYATYYLLKFESISNKYICQWYSAQIAKTSFLRQEKKQTRNLSDFCGGNSISRVYDFAMHLISQVTRDGDLSTLCAFLHRIDTPHTVILDMTSKAIL